MTDIDTAIINDRLAREVMGWEGKRYFAGNGHYYYFDDTNHFSHLWNPCDNIRQMEMCWRRMQEQGYMTAADCHWVLTEEGIGERYYSRFLWKEGPDNRFSGAGDNEALVGCQVMIRALDAERKERDDH